MSSVSFCCAFGDSWIGFLLPLDRMNPPRNALGDCPRSFLAAILFALRASGVSPSDSSLLTSLYCSSESGSREVEPLLLLSVPVFGSAAEVNLDKEERESCPASKPVFFMWFLPALTRERERCPRSQKENLFLKGFGSLFFSFFFSCLSLVSSRT
jgi:hypothetical protein